MPKWERKVLRLKEKNYWKAKPGYSIFVADRGAVRFDIPSSWVFTPGGDAITLHDKKPPDDDCRLQLTITQLPPGVDPSPLSVTELLAHASGGYDEREIEQGELVYVRRADLDLAWREIRWMDREQQREARSRHCLARGGNILPLFTLDFWPEDIARINPIWDEILRSLRLGEYVSDPRKGAPPRRWG